MTDPSDARIMPGLADVPAQVDVLVIGLGVTGAGVAVDAAARGLSVLAVDAHDVAFGTSRWSSKLVHGGLRYLASGQVGIAYESAVERGILLQRTAPHLVRPMPMIVPLTGNVSTPHALLTATGIAAGDLLRMAARTSAQVLPRPRRIPAQHALRWVPALRRTGLRGALLYWDGQLEDDARLVTCLARTAASRGAVVRTRARVTAATGTGATLCDELTGSTLEVTTRAVINATGVWAGQLAGDIRLRPSRGTHLVLRGETLPGLGAAFTVPVPGSASRFIFALPQSDGTIFVGLTDEAVEGEVPDVPEPTEAEIDFLLNVVSASLEHPLRRDDVAGAFAGLRPLLDAEGNTADLSRKHAVVTSANGVVTVVGGKLTTYRRMAADAVDAALAVLGERGRPSRTKHLRLFGGEGLAPPVAALEPSAHEHLTGRFGTEAEAVLALVADDPDLGEALVPGLPYLRAEARYAVRHEMARTLDDVLSRRTRARLLARDASAAAADDVADLLAVDLGWSRDERDAQVAGYRAAIATERGELS
jgi:glycerol-3-phosphate dehydrogenase